MIEKGCKKLVVWQKDDELAYLCNRCTGVQVAQVLNEGVRRAA